MASYKSMNSFSTPLNMPSLQLTWNYVQMVSFCFFSQYVVISVKYLLNIFELYYVVRTVLSDSPGIGTQQTSFIAQTLYHHSLLFLTVPLSGNSAWKPKSESSESRHYYEKSREWKVHSSLVSWYDRRRYFRRPRRPIELKMTC